jgi:diguanylate cyclase (GGDEF)-like protein
MSARLINALSFSVGIYMVLVGIRTFQKRQPGAWYFLLAWSALLLGAVVLPLHNMGLVPANVWNRHALMLGSAVEMLMLSFALADSINTARREKEEAQARAIESEFARIDALQSSEAELERRVHQRTLELKVANRKLHEKEVLLEHRANHDVLTGLANRMLLTTRADMGMRRSERTGKGFALAVLDLDGFKAINDKHGHAVGDELLVAVSQRMTALMRAVDTVARVGGDEFVLLLEGMDDPEHWKAFEAKLVQAIEQPVPLADGVMLRVGVSVGHAMYPAQAATFEQLMLRADQAMYTAKVWRKLNDGRGDWVLDAATMAAS